MTSNTSGEREIEVVLIEKWRRDPGGPWMRYRAVFTDDPTGKEGFGDSMLEARLDLQKRC